MTSGSKTFATRYSLLYLFQRLLAQTLCFEKGTEHFPCVNAGVVSVFPGNLHAVVANRGDRYEFVHAGLKGFHAGEHGLPHDLLARAMRARAGVPEVGGKDARLQAVGPNGAENNVVKAFQ